MSPQDRTTSTAPVAPDLLPTSISTSGLVSETEQERAVDAMSAALSSVGEPINRCVIRLEHHDDPHHRRVAIARLSVDLDGMPIRSHAQEEDLDRAVDVAAARLHERLRRHVERVQDARRHGRSIRSLDGHGRHGHDEEERVWSKRATDRADVEREIIERHPFGPPDSSIEEAAFDLESLGYAFHLFVETYTGDDVLIRRDDDVDGVLVQYASGPPHEVRDADTTAFEIDDRVVPHLDLDQAQQVLRLGDQDFVFFRDNATGRGSVVYRRADGHDGLITNPR